MCKKKKDKIGGTSITYTQSAGLYYTHIMIGQYAYFDSRSRKTNYHFLVKTDESNDKLRTCHYSLSFKKDPEPYIIFQGIVTKLDKEIKQ